MMVAKIEGSKAMTEAMLDGDVLTVTFGDTRTASYKGVTPDVFTAMVTADSVGRYFNKFIRGLDKVAK